MKYPFLILIFSFLVRAQNNLQFYLEAAEKNSALINDYKNQTNANELEIIKLKSLYLKPQINILVNYLLSPVIGKVDNQYRLEVNSSGNKFETSANGISNYYGYDLAYSNGGQYQAMIHLIQPIFNKQRYLSAIDPLLISNQINQNNIKLTKHDLQKIITDQYILCYQDKLQINFTESILKVIEEQKNILNELVKNGIYKKSDRILLEIESQNYLSQINLYKSYYKRDLLDLNILCGINDTSGVEIENPQLSLNTFSGESNFLQKYKLDSLSLVAQQKVFEIKYKPQINFFANTGLNAVYAPTIPQRLGMSAGINFTYNLYDGKQKRTNETKTKILNTTISYYKEFFITQNNVRKAKVLSELKSITERISILQKQLQEYDELLNVYKKEILSGQMSIINYINIIKNLISLQKDYAVLITQRFYLINTFNYWNW
ncbi:MAG: hypothetical protein N3F62_01970 [Bacteroidia bacterium]|nr:hypothetical protein [Bacteroidia bacterium]